MLRVIKNIKFVMLASVLIVSMLFVHLSQVQAQSEGGGSGVSLSPTRTELSILPGLSDEINISIKNITNGPIVAKPLVNDFEPNGDTGEPRLLYSEEESARSIRQFIQGLEDIELAVGETKEVNLKVVVPENAFPGGYYGAIRYQAVPAGTNQNSDGGQVSLTASVASLVLVEVPGDIEESVSVDYVRAFIGDSQGTFFTKKPDFVGISITNNGDSFVKPFGKVKVTDFRGNEVFTYEMNNFSPRGNVLPDSTRLFKDRLVNVENKVVNGEDVTEESTPITWPGRYRISADVSYGNGGEIYNVTTTFWYIPTWLIITLFVVLAVLVFGVYHLYRKYVTKSVRRK